MDGGQLPQWAPVSLSPASQELNIKRSSQQIGQGSPAQPALGSVTSEAPNEAYSVFDAYPPVFAETEGESQPQPQVNRQQHNADMNQVARGSVPVSSSMTMGSESWYDPTGADSYSTTQAFTSGQHPSSLNAANLSHGVQGGSVHQAFPQPNQDFRDYSGFDPSPFASPATSSHHRSQSFGSDFGSPAPPQPPLFRDPSQQGLSDSQHGGSWSHNTSDVGQLGGIEGMTIADNPSAGAFGDAQGFLGQSMAPSVSTSSLHSHSDYQSAIEPLASSNAGQPFADEMMQQLFSQQGTQQQQSRLSPERQATLRQSQPYQQPPIVPQVAVHNASTNDLTFEQILQHLSSEGSMTEGAEGIKQMPFPGQQAQPLQQHQTSDAAHLLGASMPWAHHQNASAPSLVPTSNASPWQTSAVLPNGSDKALLSPGDFPGRAGAPDQQQSSPSLATVSDGAARPIPTIAPVRQPTREDSFDKLKKYLKLDVNMAYAGPQDDSPTTSGMRKRSASDAGPGPFGFMTSISESIGGTLAEGKLNAEPGDLNHHSRQEAQDAGRMDGSFAPHGKMNFRWGQAPQDRGPDPSPAGGVGPMRSTALSALAREAGAGTPYSSVRPSTSQRRSAGSSSGASSASNHGDPSQIAGPSNSDAAAGWTFPGRPGNSPGYSISPRQQQQQLRRLNSGQSGHRRAAQSEDLSARALGGDHEEFLRRITAPDGSLVPPGGSGLYSQPPQANESVNLQQLYGMRHQRHASFGGGSVDGSNAGLSPSVFQQSPQNPQAYLPAGNHLAASQSGYNSRDASNSPSPLASSSSAGFSPAGATTGGSPHSGSVSPSGYSQTALPMYTTIAPRRRSNNHGGSRPPSGSLSSSGPSLSPSLANPAVQNVTTTATQAASASRRKNDAQFVCPVPGCGSQFTRQFNLRSHLRSHADERPFKCAAPGCNKAFARAHDAKRHHETLHLSVKKYICEHCGRQFARLDALHRHLKPDSGLCADKQAALVAAGGGGVGGSSNAVMDDSVSSEALSSTESFASAQEDGVVDATNTRGVPTGTSGVGGGNGGFAGHVL